MKKGRHRRFEEARALKRSNEAIIPACAECGAKPGEEHRSWCMAMEDEDAAEEETYGSALDYSDEAAHRAT
ncbi:MAG TPA: hypothetical protein VKV06_14580 [Acidimicrobiales bacterium]|nr:hypothetical protein [Acidimicrobiales bacterium]